MLLRSDSGTLPLSDFKQTIVDRGIDPSRLIPEVKVSIPASDSPRGAFAWAKRT
jgi:hypothetical protein